MWEIFLRNGLPNVLENEIAHSANSIGRNKKLFKWTTSVINTLKFEVSHCVSGIKLLTLDEISCLLKHVRTFSATGCSQRDDFT